MKAYKTVAYAGLWCSIQCRMFTARLVQNTTEYQGRIFIVEFWGPKQGFSPHQETLIDIELEIAQASSKYLEGQLTCCIHKCNLFLRILRPKAQEEEVCLWRSLTNLYLCCFPDSTKA